jgi:dynein heavy chain
VVILIDDINMPEPDVSNAQPPIELLRQLIDSGFVYDRKFFRKI